MCMLDQPNITLTPRQQRALRHLARRHMHHPRVTRRRMFADYTSPPVKTLEDEPIPSSQLIAPNEPPVGASAKLAERVSIPCPLPIYRPTGAANISTPGDTVRTQSIASNREEGQAAPDEPAQLDVQARLIPTDGEEGQPTPDEPAQPGVEARLITTDRDDGHTCPPDRASYLGRRYPQGSYTQSPGLRPGTTPPPPLREQRNIPFQGGRQR